MKSRAIKAVFDNFQFKLAAIFLGTLFWYFVQGEEILEVSQKLIVTFETPPGIIVKDGDTRVKDVTIRGPRVLVGDLSNKPPLEARVPIPAGKLGPMRIRVDKEFISDWDSRKSVTVHDEYVSLFIDEKVVRRVPIKEILQGAPSEGFIVEKVELKPNVVTVTGPKSDVSKVQEILTEPIDIDALKQSKSLEAKLVVSGLEISALSTDSVTVSLQVGEQKVNRRFANVPLEVVGGEYFTGIRPKFVAIVLQGTPGVLSFVKTADLRAFIEIRELAPGKYERDVQAKIPQDTVLIETLPQKANIEVYNQRRLN